jgi:hypothetical protein
MAKKKKKKASGIPSERLKKCISTGSVEALFPLLRDWPKKELKALLKDVETFYDGYMKVVDGRLKKIVTRLKGISEPQLRLLPPATKAFRRDVAFRLLALCSEISSVALYYLAKKGQGHAKA